MSGLPEDVGAIPIDQVDPVRHEYEENGIPDDDERVPEGPTKGWSKSANPSVLRNQSPTSASSTMSSKRDS